MDSSLFEGLTDDQKNALKSMKSKEEMMAYFDKEGIDLSDQQMEAISGGGCFTGCEEPEYCCDENRGPDGRSPR
jgi:hypothetical protein